MRTGFFLFLFLCISITCFSQWPYYYQSSLLYKKNHVKTIMTYYGDSSRSLSIDSFDYRGFLIQRKYFTNGTHIYYATSKFSYDNENNLLKEVYYTHKSSDSSHTKLFSQEDSVEITLVHDQLNRVTRRSFHNKILKTIDETGYSYDPYIETNKYSLNGHLKERIIYYDEFSGVKLIVDKEQAASGEMKESFRREFKNVYDESGRLKKCKFIDTPRNKINYDFETIKTKYYYQPNGLLDYRIYIRRSGDKIKEQYSYTYW